MQQAKNILAGVAATTTAGGGFTYDKLVGMLESLVTNVLGLGLTVATAVVVYYGFQMAFSRGDAATFTKAKEHLMTAALGAVLLFGVYTVIATIQYLADTLTK